MRRILASVLITAGAAVGFVGCSPAPSAELTCERPESPESSALQTIEVSGGFGATPTLDAYTPIRTTETVWHDLEQGEGTPVTTQRQLVAVDLTFFAGADASVRNPAGGGNSSVSVMLPMSQLGQVVPGLTESLECVRPGARVVTVVPADGIDPQTAAALGLSEGESTVVVTDVHEVFLAKADGDDRFVVGNGLPAVVRAEDGRPGITVPSGDAPDELVVQVLKEGRGAVVGPDDEVVVNYTGVTWADGEVFDSSWDGAPLRISLSQVVPGFAQAIEGQTVGSQVLAVIPPELGYGDQQSGSIPPGSTLVFVIDILGIVPAS